MPSEPLAKECRLCIMSTCSPAEVISELRQFDDGKAFFLRGGGEPLVQTYKSERRGTMLGSNQRRSELKRICRPQGMHTKQANGELANRDTRLNFIPAFGQAREP